MRSLPEMVRLLAALGAASAALFTPESWAQPYKTFEEIPELSSSDITIVRKLVRQDFTGKPAGTTLPWSNPESTNSGTVTLLDTFPSRTRECRRVRYVVDPGPKRASSSKPVSYELTNCRLSDGTWQLDNDAKRDPQ